MDRGLRDDVLVQPVTEVDWVDVVTVSPTFTCQLVAIWHVYAIEAPHCLNAGASTERSAPREV